MGHLCLEGSKILLCIFEKKSVNMWTGFVVGVLQILLLCDTRSVHTEYEIMLLVPINCYDSYTNISLSGELFRLNMS
jgi:hypothetical protein